MSETKSRHPDPEELAENAPDEVRIHDHRRFTPEGELRTQADENDASATGESAASEDLADTVETRDDALAALEERAARAEEKLRRYAAAYDQAREDAEALRRRLERDFEQRVRETLSRTFLGILGALDNLERTFEHAEAGPLLDGVKLVHKQILDLLETEGVERLEVVGRPFDPEEAEAVMATPAEEGQEKGHVIEELRPGYRFEGKILRPAQVRVAS
ncbi:MAG: nucleotide exchange factor GrpE [Acidobacteriota bacterium]|nr:nucleotide exchange factor GrpE [Acidobacteriota bacterium]MDQ7087360.1 nucleotide exchange factor GrpE [Acidobacteriota bacterium]